jgi:hypothetical protein
MSLAEARRQGQREMFADVYSADPLEEEVKRLRQRRKRQAKQPGVILHD